MPAPHLSRLCPAHIVRDVQKILVSCSSLSPIILADERAISIAFGQRRPVQKLAALLVDAMLTGVTVA